MTTSSISRRRFLLAGAAALTASVAQLVWYLRDTPGGELSAGDFGATGDGVADDGPALRRALRAAQASGPGATVRLGPGRYRVGEADSSGYALPVVGGQRLAIEGEDATIVVTDPAIGCLRFTDSRECRVRGITIDYEPQPAAETVVTAVHRSTGTFEVETVRGSLGLDDPSFRFPRPDERHPGAFGAVFDPRTRRLKDGVPDHVFVVAADRRGPRRYRLRPRDGRLPLDLAVGDLFVYVTRLGGHALACYRSPAMRIADVHVRAANSVAFALVQSSSARIAGCTVAFGPDSQRLITTNADGVHAQACPVGPTVENCRFTGMMDDGLNVYVPPLEVISVRGAAEIEVTGPVPVRAGDRLEFSDPVSGRVKGMRRVESAIAAGDERLRLRLAQPLSGLSAEPGHDAGDHAFNLSASGEGYLVRDNVYEHHRGHAMRLHTGKGVVEGNRIRHTSRDGMLVFNDPDWPEGPHTRDLVIRGNTFEATGGDAAIDIEGRRLGYRLAVVPTQRGIRVLDNTFRNWQGSAIAVGAARDITLRDNVLIIRGEQAARQAERGVLVEHARDVVVDGLIVRTDGTHPLSAAVEIAATVDDGREGVRVRRVEAPRGVQALRDRRVDTNMTNAFRRSRAAEAVELAARLGPVG